MIKKESLIQESSEKFQDLPLHVELNVTGSYFTSFSPGFSEVWLVCAFPYGKPMDVVGDGSHYQAQLSDVSGLLIVGIINFKESALRSLLYCGSFNM